MRIVDLLSKDSILLNASPKNKAEAIDLLYKALVGQMIQTLFQFQILIHKTISFFDLIFLQVLFNLHGLCRMQTSKSLFGFIL